LVLSTLAFTLLFAVWLMFACWPAHQGAAAPRQDPVSWLTAIAVLSGSIWRLPFGILTDRVGGRRLFVFLLIASAIPLLVSRGPATRADDVCLLLRIAATRSPSHRLERGVGQPAAARLRARTFGAATSARR